MNYQNEMEAVIQKLPAGNTKLLLHSCCAPCSCAVLENISRFFDITVFYYNPNITDYNEYRKRVEEQKRLINTMPFPHHVDFMEGLYEPELFFEMSKGLEKCPEGQERCFSCYELRLKKTAEIAKMQRFDYFTTTLTISPLKRADILNEIGNRLGILYDVAFLPSDFKKKDGYKRSIELSNEYGLYRQNYCGCCFSQAESLKKKGEN